MDPNATPTRRTLLSDNAGVELAAPPTPTLPTRPSDPLAGALPSWDLVPATRFLRRR